DMSSLYLVGWACPICVDRPSKAIITILFTMFVFVCLTMLVTLDVHHVRLCTMICPHLHTDAGYIDIFHHNSFRPSPLHMHQGFHGYIRRDTIQNHLPAIKHVS